jgi:hypothetical protein
VRGTIAVSANRGIQWNRSQIMVLGGSTGKKGLISEGYHYAKWEERNPVG